jgi:hypothetical protein
MSEWQPDYLTNADDARALERIRDDDDLERERDRRDRQTRDAGEHRTELVWPEDEDPGWIRWTDEPAYEPPAEESEAA